jgi:hypothetical protein
MLDAMISDAEAAALLDVDPAELDELADELDVPEDGWTADDIKDAYGLLNDDDGED